MDTVTIIGNHAVSGKPIGVPIADRFRHMLVAGATGTGKSTLLRRIAAADIRQGQGVLVIDPHGSLADEVLSDVPASRANHVACIDPSDAEFPIAINLLDDVHPDHRATAADGLVSGMRTIWSKGWGDRMEDILRNSLTALIEHPAGTLATLPRFLTDEAFRARVLAHCSSPIVRLYFANEFESWSEDFRNTAVAPVLNKIREFLIIPAVLNMVGQPHSTFHLDYAMQHRRVVILNLAKGVIGESAAHLLGALIISRVLTHAMERSTNPREKWLPFHVIADELPVFATDATARLLSEGRKFNVSLTGAVQSLMQIDEPLRTIMLSNTATKVVFRTGERDAERFSDELQLGGASAVLNRAFGKAWMQPPWSADVFPVDLPPPAPTGRDGSAARKQSRQHFGRPRAAVEQRIRVALGVDRHQSKRG